MASLLRWRVWSRLALAGGFCLLAGCGTLSAVSFQRSELSGVSGSRFVVHTTELLDKDTGGTEGEAIRKAIRDDEELQDAIKSARQNECAPEGGPTDGDTSNQSRAGVAKMSVAELAGLELLTSIALNAFERRVERIVAAASVGYSATRSMTVEELGRTKCLLLVRHAPVPGSNGFKATRLGLVAMLKLDTIDSGAGNLSHVLVFRPLLWRMFNAVAVTRESTSPSVSAAVALSIKALTEPELGIERFASSGQAAVSIPITLVGKAHDGADPPKSSCVRSMCSSSEPIPYPKGRGALWLTVAVGEQGVTGFDEKSVSALIRAIREVAGSTIGSLR